MHFYEKGYEGIEASRESKIPMRLYLYTCIVKICVVESSEEAVARALFQVTWKLRQLFALGIYAYKFFTQ